MIKSLIIIRFKSFETASLPLGPFTVICGANASGKSNLRDAFRFLHGVSRGYSLSETFSGKYGEGGEKVWSGIRGGFLESANESRGAFSIHAEMVLAQSGLRVNNVNYNLSVMPAQETGKPRVMTEGLKQVGETNWLFGTQQGDSQLVTVKMKETNQGTWELDFSRDQPVLTQITERLVNVRGSNSALEITETVNATIAALGKMRFVNMNPDTMREPAFPGQLVLGDMGENLPSVLQAICEDPQQKLALTEWLQELTPMDVSDVQFEPDPTGKIHLFLIEKNGRKTSAYSASDGTLRFLGILAALLGPKPAGFYFFEELENGIHPTRLHLLVRLIEKQVAKGKIQVVATTHSPQVLAFLTEKSLEHAAVTYRLEGQPDTRIKRIMDIPYAREVIQKKDLASLHASGWLEDAIAFSENDEEGGQ